MKRIPRVYISGRYTSPSRWNEEQYVRDAEAVGYRMAAAGCYPVIPHANTRHYFSSCRTPEFWYRATLEAMATCDAVVMVPGWEQSVGATAEKAEAERMGIPVFLYESDIVAWMETQTD